jgi:hypothetical protein
VVVEGLLLVARTLIKSLVYPKDSKETNFIGIDGR